MNGLNMNIENWSDPRPLKNPKACSILNVQSTYTHTHIHFGGIYG